MKGDDLPISKFGQDFLARTEFDKGLGFLMASGLLVPLCVNEATHYVRLHLICQGIELILKSALLAKDFAEYRPRLSNPKQFGHNLIKTAEAAEKEFGFSPTRAVVREELIELARLYSNHSLRYAGLNDIFINPTSIRFKKVLRRTTALVKVMNREFTRINFGQP